MLDIDCLLKSRKIKAEKILNRRVLMKKGIIYIFITAFAFSTMEIVGKLISTQINPFQLTFIRFFIGSIFLY